MATFTKFDLNYMDKQRDDYKFIRDNIKHLENIVEDLESDDFDPCEYFNDVYAIEQTKDLISGDVKGYNIMIAFGGPNIYIKTIECEAIMYWGDIYKVPFSYDAAEKIDNYFNDWC